MSRNFHRLGLTALAVLASPALDAQTGTTGALNGVVAEKGGAPIAGATVTITSGQIVRTAATGADGHYNAGLLNPGPVTVAISKPGYVTSRQSVNIQINVAVTANFKVAREGSALVEVLASATAIDSTSTTTGANFSMEDLADLPKGRDIGDVAFMTPGVSRSGFGAGDNLGLNISIAGASGAENAFSVDGLRTNDMRYGGQGVQMSQEFVDQIEIQTGGYKPEYSAMGGVFNVSTKSGGNRFAGSAWADASPGSLSPALKRSPYVSESVPGDIFELGALASGAFVTDKFFYAVGLNWLQASTPASPNLDGFTVGGTTAPAYQYFVKLNYFVNTDNQLTVSCFGSMEDARQADTAATPGGSGHGTQFDGIATRDDSSNLSLVWDATLAPNFTLSVKLGQATRLNQVTPTQDIDELEDYTYWDPPTANGVFPGGQGWRTQGPAQPPNTKWFSGGIGERSKETDKLDQGSIDFTWVLGAHSLKGGFSDMTSRYENDSFRSGADSSVWYTNIDSSGNLQLSRRLYTNQSVANAEFQALYLQDTWQASKGLNLFYGARAEHQVQKGVNGQAFMSFGFGKYIQPRIGFTWDARGDSTSKVSGSFAVYYEQIPQRMAIRTFGNEHYYLYNYYSTKDAPGYGGPAIPWTAAAASAPWTLVAGQTPVLAANFSTGWSHDPIADGIKLPQRIELQLGYDRQVSATTTLGLHGRYRKLTNPIEDSAMVVNNGSGTAIDPKDTIGQAIIWNPNANGATWTSPFTGTRISSGSIGYPTAYNSYKALDASCTYKASDTLLFVGYTWSRSFGNYEGVISPSNGQPDGNITASYDYQPYVGTGLLPTDRTHQVKAYGSHRYMVGAKDSLTVGFNFLAQSGVPISLQDDGSTSAGLAPGTLTAQAHAGTIPFNPGDPGHYGSATFANGRMGQYGRTPFATRLDLNASFTHLLGPRMKVAPYVQFYNLLNSRPTTSVHAQATDSQGNPQAFLWDQTTGWQAQRSIRFGAKLTF